MTEVKNISFTMKQPFANPREKGYDSWEEYWKANANGPFPEACQNVDCDGKAEVCAHVKSVLGERKWYIVPLCKKCNQPTNTKTFHVNDEYLITVSDEYEEDILDELMDVVFENIAAMD